MPNLPPVPYLSSLTPVQHHLVRHAAAALLLKDHRHGRGVFEGIERVIERLWEKGEEVEHHGGKGRPVSASQRLFHPRSSRHDDGLELSSRETLAELFGTPLKYLTKHEGVDSFHGADPHGTVRIPEFVDHCITALKMMGTSAVDRPLRFVRFPRGASSLDPGAHADMTTEGILRKSGKFRVINEIIDALDSSGGNDTVIDLAALWACFPSSPPLDASGEIRSG